MLLIMNKYIDAFFNAFYYHIIKFVFDTGSRKKLIIYEIYC